MMDIKKIFQLLVFILDKRTHYKEFIEFVFKETPPHDHAFLARIDPAGIVAEEKTSFHYAAHQENAPSRDVPRFSVVVPTYNGASFSIRRTIASLILQAEISPKEYEIIIVDDCSTDDTARVVHEELRRADAPAFRYIRLQKNSGPAVARNIGIIRARGEYVCFTDDDCIVPTDWILNFRKTFGEHPEAAGVGGWFTSPSKKNTLLHKYYVTSHSCEQASRKKTSTTYYGVTGNMCYKKSALEKVGGFSNYMPFPCFDDIELTIRMHKNNFLLLGHSCVVQHLTPMSLNLFFRRIPRRGWARLLIRLMHPEYNSRIFSDKYGYWASTFWKMQNICFSGNADIRVSFFDRCLFKGIIVLEETLSLFGKCWIGIRLHHEHSEQKNGN